MNDVDNKTVRCHTRFIRKRLAGEKFRDSPKDCFTQTADEKHYCRGAVYGHSCSNNGDADCDVDMYCSERKVCEHAKLEGEYCNSHERCASYLICAWEDGVDSRCRPYGFYPNDKQLGPGDEDEICQSRFLNDDFKCEHAPSLEHSNLRDKPGDKCVYTHGPLNMARCYYQKEGKAICRKGAAQQQPDWEIVCLLYDKIHRYWPI